MAPTLYEILGITPPRVVNGQEQIKIDGTSFAYTLTDGSAAPKKQIQFFDNNGSRGIYQDGWFAAAFGAFIPWNTPASAPRVANWDSATDPWELYNLKEDFSQADDLSSKMPQKLAELKKEFLALAEDNKLYGDRKSVV